MKEQGVKRMAWAAAFAAAATMGCTASAEDKPGFTDTPMLPDGKWRVHDAERPHPEVVTPGDVASAPPSDAVVLFDGTSLDAWQPQATPWTVEGGAVISTPRAQGEGENALVTKQSFGDVQLHLEFRSPNPPESSSQDRGNSGIWFMQRYEIQILDGYNNPTYADGTVGVSGIVIAVEDLDLVALHEPDAAVAPVLRAALRRVGRAELQVELHVTEALLGDERVLAFALRARGRDDRAAFDRPGRCLGLPGIERCPVEQHDRIRRRRASHVAGRHDLGMRALCVVDPPLAIRQHRRVGKARLVLRAGGAPHSRGRRKCRGPCHTLHPLLLHAASISR